MGADFNQVRGSIDDMKGIGVTLPRLSPDSPDSCPVKVKSLIEYLAMEAPWETETGEPIEPKPTLQFLRSAIIGQTHYWIWAFKDGRGTDCFAVVSRWPKFVVKECDETFGFTPEQHLVALHFKLEP
jgi:hypothetical protein